jgi:PadR family transcriptional regulator PadR
MMASARIDLLQPTRGLLISCTLTLGAEHGWAIAERVQQVSSLLRIQQGSLYPALHRLGRRGWIKTPWETIENNLRVKYYPLTKCGHKQLEVGKDTRERLTVAKQFRRRRPDV